MSDFIWTLNQADRLANEYFCARVTFVVFRDRLTELGFKRVRAYPLRAELEGKVWKFK